MSKNRTQSRCREWEKERRNKFNKAITSLGELIKTVKGKESDMTQCSKIEIIQKAIAFITDNSEDISRLKAEILALQVKLEEIKNKQSTKDACTQKSISAKTKLKSSKYNRSLMIKKCKHNALKEKPILPKLDQRNMPALAIKPNNSQGGVFILPKASNAKAQENTFVVVPATPYMIPQRPLLLPTAPPTFILLNPNNMQAINNPVGPRTSKDSTKTTMVNVLPISAYSHPHSANKPKKVAGKKKTKTAKKKKTDGTEITTQTGKANNENTKTATDNTVVTLASDVNPDQSKEADAILKEVTKTKDDPKQTKEIKVTISKVVEVSMSVQTITVTKPNDTITTLHSNIDNKIAIIKNAVSQDKPKTPVLDTTLYKAVKMDTEKDVSAQHAKSKMPLILDTALCENTVDGGNARLELAEELLAASPTAAFLMSFPLVSGNRADSPVEEIQPLPIPHKDIKITVALETATAGFFPKPKEKLKKPESSIIKQTSEVCVSKAEQTTGIKKADVKFTSAINAVTESPFLNLQMPSIVSSGCSLPDASFPLDFDCNISKSLPSQPASYVSNSNLFYKGDAINTVKSSIYSTSSISSGHDFNSLGIYPCAIEKYTSKNKSDFSNVDENIIKLGSSRLTYDIDLGWSQKSLDFNCSTNAPTLGKDNLLTSVASSYSSSYNPFNPEFHVPLVGNTNKKDNFSKPSSSFADSISNFYPQTSSLWSEDVPFYTNSGISMSKPQTTKQPEYSQRDHSQAIVTTRQSNAKLFDTKQVSDHRTEGGMKAPALVMPPQMPEIKYTKKSPTKMHINWMTSEIRPSQNISNVHPNDIKELTRTPYGQFDQNMKKQETNEGNYFPISVPNHNYPTQVAQEDFLMWPSARPLGTTEISIEPPPINLPTLVGDLALGPHEKKRHAEMNNRLSQPDQSGNNFFSVTQLMNRSSENMASRFPMPNADHTARPEMIKQNISHYSSHRKLPRLEAHPSYPYEMKSMNAYEPVNSFSNCKTKPAKVNDKNTKLHKNSYSAEALIRGGGSANQKVPENKLMMPQKYNEYNSQQDSSVAQVTHFPPMIDYSDNNFAGQQLSGTNLYNSTTNTISNSFYTNFMPGSSNLMSSNYAGTPFSGEFIDYSQSAECNFPNHKYEEFKMRGNLPVAHDKPANKTSKREMPVKHKMECSKKDSKRYHSKKAKLGAEIEEWSDGSMWQNKTPVKRHSNIMDEQISFPNYMGNQMAPQYQSDILNNHLLPHVQGAAASFPTTSRANFNLSTIFPEITMKVQS